MDEGHAWLSGHLPRKVLHGLQNKAAREAVTGKASRGREGAPKAAGENSCAAIEGACQPEAGLREGRLPGTQIPLSLDLPI